MPANPKETTSQRMRRERVARCRENGHHCDHEGENIFTHNRAWQCCVCGRLEHEEHGPFHPIALAQKQGHAT